jgi:hypothetical protein
MAWGAWDGPTALTLYWLEGVFAVLLVGLRIEAHRWLTGKRGHDGSGLLVTTTVDRRRQERTVRSFLLEYLVSTIVFQAFAAFALVLAVGRVFGGTPTRAGLEAGLVGVVLFQAVGLVADLPGLSERPFRWIKHVAMNSLGRAGWLMLALLGGWWWSARHGGDTAAFLAAFVLLKLTGDVLLFLRLRGLEDRVYGPRPPRWLAALMRLVGPGFEEHWAKEHAEEKRRAAEDEEVGAS